MVLSRGALVTVALQGDHDKPRPALVIQSDLFSGTATAVMLPMSSTLVETPLGRVTVEPTETNGLRAASQVMVDKPIAVPTHKIGPAFGRLDDAALLEVSRALALFVGIAR